MAFEPPYAALGGMLALSLSYGLDFAGLSSDPEKPLVRERKVLAAAGIAGGFAIGCSPAARRAPGSDSLYNVVRSAPMNRTGLVIALTIGLVVGVVFGVVPRIDFAAATPFYDPKTHDFPLNGQVWTRDDWPCRGRADTLPIVRRHALMGDLSVSAPRRGC